MASIEYVDEKGESCLKKIVKAQREGKMQFDDALPPFFVEFEHSGNPRYLDISEYVVGGIMYAFFLDQGFFVGGHKTL